MTYVTAEIPDEQITVQSLQFLYEERMFKITCERPCYIPNAKNPNVNTAVGEPVNTRPTSEPSSKVCSKTIHGRW